MSAPEISDVFDRTVVQALSGLPTPVTDISFSRARA
jgi:hypothetical protein